jgi:DNA-binding FrmR family transcriptional regulator
VNEQDKKVRDRLRRAEGQIGGIIRMLEEGRACEDIVTQLMAVRTAVDRAAAQIVSAHIDECMASQSAEQARDRVKQAIKLLGRIS